MADDFESLKREVAEVQRSHDQMIGQYREMRKYVKKKFGCKTLKEAEKLLPKIHKEMMTATRIYLKRMKAYKRELRKSKERLNGKD